MPLFQEVIKTTLFCLHSPSIATLMCKIPHSMDFALEKGVEKFVQAVLMNPALVEDTHGFSSDVHTNKAYFSWWFFFSQLWG